MHEVKLSNGKTLVVEPLSRQQIQNLGKFGFSYIGFRPKFDLDNAEGINQTIDAVIDEIKADAPPKDYPVIFQAVINQTYGTEEEKKT